MEIGGVKKLCDGHDYQRYTQGGRNISEGNPGPGGLIGFESINKCLFIGLYNSCFRQL